MDTRGHYDVVYFAPHEGWRRGQVKSITCNHCPYRVSVVPLHRAGDLSGQGRYNRARARVVKHLHAEHRETLGSDSKVDG